MAKKNWKNPFYALLIPVGLLFVVTGFAYGFMAFQAVNAGAEGAGIHANHPLFQWLKNNGDWAILGELAVLAVLTVSAIATDEWWMNRSGRDDADSATPDPHQPDQMSESQTDG